MPRRRTSLFDDLASAPWQLGAIAGFVVLGAGLVLFPALLAGSSNMFLAAIGKALAAGTLAPLIWACAIACWAAAGVSALLQSRRRKLLDTRTDLDSLRAMSWRELEQLVSEAYRRLGFQVEQNTALGADGGVDLRLHRNGQLTLVQCKHWRSQRVGAPVVREQFGLQTHHQATAVVIVTTGDFTAEARAFARGKPIELVAGPELLSLVRDLQEATPTELLSSPVMVEAQVTCPKCASPMVRRKARQTGAEFLGCSRFPACRGTRTA